MNVLGAFILFGALLCVKLSGVASLVVTSLADVREIANLSLAKNLERFIKHEEIRLKVIHNVSRYEREEPSVIQRIKEFKILHKELVKNETANDDLIRSAKEGHPTSVYVVIRNFVGNWEHMFANRTLYGKRLMEFLDDDQHFELPRQKDLRKAGTAIAIIMATLNVSLHDVIRGNILGHQGQPLNAADCYDIAKACVESQLVDEAKLWLETAFGDADLSKVKADSVPFNVTDALLTLSKLVFQDGDNDKAVRLLERATDIDPDDIRLHQLYLQHRFGRDVKPMPRVNTKKMELWRTNFFEGCKNATLSPQPLNMTVSFKRRKCRYRSSPLVPYRRYQEEILNFAPYISVIYDFVSPQEIALVRNATHRKFTEGILPGNDKATLWQYKALTKRDNDDVISDISYRSGDVTGLDVTQTNDFSLGEPVHIIDFGVAGTGLPTVDSRKWYPVTYMGFSPGNRLATIRVFLSDTKAGGEVIFANPLVTVRPRQGMALLYYNYKPNGTGDDRVYVGTCPLAVGENLILEKGIWSTGLDTNVLCGKRANSTFIGVEKSKLKIAPLRLPEVDKPKEEKDKGKDSEPEKPEDK